MKTKKATNSSKTAEKINPKVYHIDSKTKFKKAIQVLNKSKPIQKKRFVYHALEKQCCKKSIIDLVEEPNRVQSKVDPMSYTQILIEMRKCIVLQDWNNLTRLLVDMFNAERDADIIKWRYALVNLVNNPLVRGKNYFQDFFKMCLGCSSKLKLNKALQKILNDALNRKEELEELSDENSDELEDNKDW